ncbi:MAG: hypothetical protein ACK5NT_04180 [Pyrinomonadaceae bacterium]
MKRFPLANLLHNPHRKLSLPVWVVDSALVPDSVPELAQIADLVVVQVPEPDQPVQVCHHSDCYLDQP